jgi:predicted DNA-binding transcriptional regulator AlpA
MQRAKSAHRDLQRRFVSESELEQITGISKRTWQKHRLLKRGPQHYKIYGSVRYDLEEVLAWIKTRLMDTPTARMADLVEVR